MKKINFTSALFLLASLLFFSCSTSIKVKAEGSDGAGISFSTEFSKKLTAAFSELTGAAETSALVSEEEIKGFMSASGAQNVSAQKTQSGALSAEGTLTKISSSSKPLSKIIKRTPSSLSLTLGPESLVFLYENLDDEAKGYLDLLMIPCLNDEKMSFEEYEDLLASVYGNEIASEITNSVLNIELTDSRNTKTVSEKIKLGTVLTLTQNRSWSVSF